MVDISVEEFGRKVEEVLGPLDPHKYQPDPGRVGRVLDRFSEAPVHGQRIVFPPRPAVPEPQS